MRQPARGRLLARVAVAALVLCVAAVAFVERREVARAAIVAGLAVAGHVRVSFATMHLGGDRSEFSEVRVTSLGGEPIARIARLEIGYDLRGLMGGSGRLFGLRSIDLVTPHITIVRHPDGTYNIPISNGGRGSAAAQFALHAAISDGSIDVIDEGNVDPHQRHLYVREIHGTGDLASSGPSHYTLGFAYGEQPGRLYPVRGAGDVDARDGYAMQHWTAALLPIAGAVDFALDSPGLHLSAGELHGLDARVFGFADASGSFRSHFAASAYLQGARLAIGGLAKPVRDVRGRIDVYDGGLLSDGLDATIAGVPAHVAGGVYDLAQPKLRLAVRGSGDLERLRTAFAQSAHLPMHGRLDFSMLVEGSPSAPLEWIALRAPRIKYRGSAIVGTHGLVAFDGTEADVMGLQARYGKIQARADGRIALQSRTGALTMVVAARAAPNALPHSASLVPGLGLTGFGLATADDPKAIDVKGVVSGASSNQRLDGTFDVDSTGTGSIGPLYLGNDRGSIYARLALDRPHRASAGFIDARNFALPALQATLDGSAVGAETPGEIALIGDGRYAGSLAAPARLGIPVPAVGSVVAPVAFAYANGEAIVQIDNARFSHAAIAGLPLQGLSATLGATKHGVRVYTASARIGGSQAIAAGTTERGGTIALSASRIALGGAAQRAGAPVNPGLASLGATVSGPLTSPRIASAVVVQGGRYRNLDLRGNATLSYSGGTLALHEAAAQLGPAFVGAAGTIDGVSAGRSAPHYHLHARLQSSDVQALLAIVRPDAAPAVAGSVDADVHVGGSGANPSVAGTLSAGGSINGLAFRDLRAGISGDPNAMDISGGHVVVGSTAVAFSGAAVGNAVNLALSAPRADLADFNDLFDTGDTFAGTGSLAMNAAMAGNHLIASSGSARFEHARFRRLDLGSVSARWQSHGSAIASDLTLGGAAGEMRVIGSIDPQAMAVNLRASLRDMDLATWTPMLGIELPVTGRLNADATASGRYPDLAMDVHAAVFGGTAGRFTIQKFQIAATAARGYGTIRSAVLEIPNLSTVASGTFGLHPGDRLDLVAHSTSPDVGALASVATGKTIDAAGSLSSTLRVVGTRDDPAIVDDVTLASLRYGSLVVPRVAGEVAASQTVLTLRNGEADLERGRLLLSGSMARNGRVSGNLIADDVDASNVGTLLPKGSHIGGRVDGRVNIAGTLRAPRANGSLALRDGTFIGPMERAPIKDADAVLAFADTRVTLQSAHAYVGGGSIAAGGSAEIAGLQGLNGLAFELHARADNAHLEMPAYFQGNLDGHVSVTRHASGPATVGGDVALSSARIPLSAFYNPRAQNASPAHLPEVAFNHLRIAAGRDVRVQSSEVDVAAAGSATLSGTLAAPRLAGVFDSSGGTIDFYHNFVLERGRVAFDPSNGVIPDVDAVATTYIADPATDVRLHVTGPATDMNLALESEPSYDRQQILGLLLGMQQFGAVRGVQSQTASGGFSLPATARNVTLGEANQVFVRRLLEPASLSIGSAMGFTDLQITNDLQGGLGLNAVKAFGKNVSATASANLGSPKSESVALEAHPSVATGLRLQVYTSEGPTLFSLQQPTAVGLDALNLNPMTQLQSVGGTSGVNFSYVHRFAP